MVQERQHFLEISVTQECSQLDVHLHSTAVTAERRERRFKWSSLLGLGKQLQIGTHLPNHKSRNTFSTWENVDSRNKSQNQLQSNHWSGSD
ncbi:unnamed protein product [Calypogeia fissa]